MTPAAAHARSVHFVARAAAWMAMLYGVYYYPYAADSAAHRLIDAFLQLQARGSAALIELFDASASAHGRLISGQFPLEVVRSCSSLDAQALYAAIVVAFPSPLRAKLLGLVLGCTVLTVLNMIRIASLYFVGAHAPGSFDTVHEELFPFLLIAGACACFAAWVHWALRTHHASAA